MRLFIILHYINLGLLSLSFLLFIIYITVRVIIFKLESLFKVTNLYTSPRSPISFVRKRGREPRMGRISLAPLGGLNLLNRRYFTTSNFNRDNINKEDELDLNKGSVDTSKAIKKFSDVVTNSADIKAFIKNKSGIYM